MGFLGTTDKDVEVNLCQCPTLPFINVIDLDKEQEFLSAATF